MSSFRRARHRATILALTPAALAAWLLVGTHAAAAATSVSSMCTPSLPDFAPLVARYGPAVVNVEVIEKASEGGSQGDDHLAHGAPAVMRILRQQGSHQPEQARRRDMHRLDGRYRFVEYATHIEVGKVRRATGQQLEGQRTQTVQVIGRRGRQPRQLLGAGR